MNTIEIKVRPMLDDLTYGSDSDEFIRQAWEDAMDVVRVLMEHGYQARLHMDEWFLCIEFDFDDENLTDELLLWMNANEYEDFRMWKNHKRDDNSDTHKSNR